MKLLLILDKIILPILTIYKPGSLCYIQVESWLFITANDLYTCCYVTIESSFLESCTTLQVSSPPLAPNLVLNTKGAQIIFVVPFYSSLSICVKHFYLNIVHSVYITINLFKHHSVPTG